MLLFDPHINFIGLSEIVPWSNVSSNEAGRRGKE